MLYKRTRNVRKSADFSAQCNTRSDRYRDTKRQQHFIVDVWRLCGCALVHRTLQKHYVQSGAAAVWLMGQSSGSTQKATTPCCFRSTHPRNSGPLENSSSGCWDRFPLYPVVYALTIPTHYTSYLYIHTDYTPFQRPHMFATSLAPQRVLRLFANVIRRIRIIMVLLPTTHNITKKITTQGHRTAMTTVRSFFFCCPAVRKTVANVLLRKNRVRLDIFYKEPNFVEILLNYTYKKDSSASALWL